MGTKESLKVPFELSASAGFCAIHPNDRGKTDDYIRIADESMYEEKEKAHRKLNAKS